MRQYALGIDLGGTGTKFGLVDEGGQVLRSDSIPTQQYPDIVEYCDVLCAGLIFAFTLGATTESIRRLFSASGSVATFPSEVATLRQIVVTNSALRSHPFPFRTGSLSSATPMVLHVVGE